MCKRHSALGCFAMKMWIIKEATKWCTEGHCDDVKSARSGLRCCLDNWFVGGQCASWENHSSQKQRTNSALGLSGRHGSAIFPFDKPGWEKTKVHTGKMSVR